MASNLSTVPKRFIILSKQRVISINLSAVHKHKHNHKTQTQDAGCKLQGYKNVDCKDQPQTRRVDAMSLKCQRHSCLSPSSDDPTQSKSQSQSHFHFQCHTYVTCIHIVHKVSFFVPFVSVPVCFFF